MGSLKSMSVASMHFYVAGKVCYEFESMYLVKRGRTGHSSRSVRKTIKIVKFIGYMKLFINCQHTSRFA
jgi:hypothetical protein